MILLGIKPLSVNKAWKGRRYKTDEYKRFERDVSFMLPKLEIPEGKLKVFYEFGFSNKLSDIDNPIKLFQDILQKKFGFNDSQIYEMNVKKEIVKKGNEYILFNIEVF